MKTCLQIHDEDWPDPVVISFYCIVSAFKRIHQHWEIKKHIFLEDFGICLPKSVCKRKCYTRRPFYSWSINTDRRGFLP